MWGFNEENPDRNKILSEDLLPHAFHELVFGFGSSAG